MRVLSASLLISVSIILFSGCGDSSMEITGTLPVVTGITVDSMASRGDTIVVTWDSLPGTQIDGYLFWYRIHQDEPWMLVESVVGTTGVHIATRSAYYTVMAYYGDDTSMNTGISDNTMPEELAPYSWPIGGKARGFRVDIEGDSLISGDPYDANFHQQFIVSFAGLGLNRFIFPGNAKPEMWPGGTRTTISACGGFVAPAPGDTVLWQDSIPLDSDFFLGLETGYYCKLDGGLIPADTLGSSDTLQFDGGYQPLLGVRVFEQTW